MAAFRPEVYKEQCTTSGIRVAVAENDSTTSEQSELKTHYKATVNRQICMFIMFIHPSVIWESNSWLGYDTRLQIQ